MTLEILVNTAIRMLLVGAAAWLVLRIVRVRNPHVEALVWRLLLLAGLAMPVLLYWRLAPSFTTSLQLPVIAVTGADSAAAAAGVENSFALPLGVLTAIYFGVALLLLARLAAGLIGMWRISRAARPLATPDDVRTSARVRSPATFGTIILLPAEAHGWPAERLDVVLAHERAHVRSRDGYWSWLAQIHAAIFWFSPLAWWSRHRLETLAETTSDDAVVAARHDPLAYAALVLDFARNPNSRSVAMSIAESNVSRRIERLLARTPPGAALPRIARFAAFALLIPAVMFAASTTRAAPAEPVAASVPASSDALPRASVRLVKAALPGNFYPAVAKALGVSGDVLLQATIDPLGQLVDVVVLDVQPADPQFGFADAALQVARASQYRNPGGQALSLKFRVKFAPNIEELKGEEPKKE